MFMTLSISQGLRIFNVNRIHDKLAFPTKMNWPFFIAS